MKTRAAILWKSNQPLIIDEVEIPSLKRGQVLVKIFYSGICRAQYNEIIALKGPDKFLPHLLGHEASGEVVDYGAGITKVKKGDTVCLSWIKGKGLDGINSQYKFGSRVINAGGVTTFSDYAVVSENRITRIAKNTDRKVAAIVGCAVLTGSGIINNTLKAQQGKSLVVFGAGGVGLNVIMAAHAKGLNPIVAVDINPKKLIFAKNLGATHVLTANSQIIKKLFTICPNGFDFAVDASGNKTAMEAGFSVIANHGVMAIAGNLGINEKISIHPFDLIKGKRIIGTWGGESLPDRDVPIYLKNFNSGKLPIDQLITHTFKLEDINKAFSQLTNAHAGRIIIELNS